ncbi:MAG: mechanosensitive ion channel [Hahellaceae bacterium]|nr:mechanosensitive ion channel [Hahellaceae bacterium]MCP5210231.1 mechanosensitive ion channel [Hahellaceae bacterium]
MNNEIVSDITSLANLFDVYKLLLLLVAGVGLWSVNFLIRLLAERLMLRFTTQRFLILQFSTLLTFSIYIFGGVGLVISIIQPPKEFMIAAGGSIAVAMGIALKDVAASVVAGFLLLFEKPFQAGDKVSFGDVYGEIVSIGLRSVRLQTLDDNLVTIPNSRFITEVVASGNAGALDMMVVTDFHLALNADISEAINLIREVIITSRFVFLKKPVGFSVTEEIIGEQLAIRIRAKAYVFDTHHEKDLQTDIVLRTTRLFHEREIPRPAIRYKAINANA